jgi:hypothetical protein
MTNSIFGQVIDGAQVEDTVKAHLQNWLPTYVAQLADDRGLDRGAFPLPKQWLNSTEEDTDWEARNLPAILIISSGIDGRPIREGDGSFRAAWVIGIAVVVTAGGVKGGKGSRSNTATLARRYGAAIRWAMMQYTSLGNPNVEDVDWIDESYDDVPSDESSALASAQLVFRIEMRDVLNDTLGPGEPDPIPDPIPNPYPDWGVLPDIDHVGISLTKEPINE